MSLTGRTFRVAYEARTADRDDDLAQIAELARGRTCILDVGANVGLTALVMGSVMHDDGVLYAFDASEACCLVIRENAFLNSLHSKITIVNALVSDEGGCVQKFNWNFVSGNASTVRDSLNGYQLPFYKSTITLDNFAAAMNISPDFIKIDVEGAELQVLRGMLSLLSKSKPLVWIEFHAWPNMTLQQGMQRALALLQPLDYEVLDPQTGQRITRADQFAKGNTAPYGRAYGLLKSMAH